MDRTTAVVYLIRQSTDWVKRTSKWNECATERVDISKRFRKATPFGLLFFLLLGKRCIIIIISGNIITFFLWT